MLPTLPPRTLLAALALASAAAGCWAAWHYFSIDLTLSHYDAKAHLVVARRVFDSLTPGWKQFGAVWLPLPHVLNVLPVQVDALYRTGLSGVVISVGAFALATTALAYLTWRLSGSRLAGLAASVVFASDPNVLYLQSTPMTEPLLFGLLAASAALVARWLAFPARRPTWQPGLAMAFACLTRYEAWPVTVALLTAALLARWRQDGWSRAALAGAVRSVARIAAWPLGAVLLFIVNSKVSTDAWFVTGGFFVAENEALGRPAEALNQVIRGATRLMGPWTVRLGALGALVALWWALRRPAHHARSRAWLALSLAGTAALPVYAFLQGHPFRIRYMVALVLVTAVGAGFAVAAWPRRWLRVVAAAVVIAVSLGERPPLDASAPMVLEAQWDRPRTAARREVTACLLASFDRPRHKILASMGSLAHYMQETSHAGFRLDDFVHEGTDIIWGEALAAPQRHVQWILFEERAEGGDMLTQRRAQDPAFVEGFERVCQSGGVALYRRAADSGDRPLTVN